jgi:hypothetical protein
MVRSRDRHGWLRAQVSDELLERRNLLSAAESLQLCQQGSDALHESEPFLPFQVIEDCLCGGFVSSEPKKDNNMQDREFNIRTT